VPYCACLTISAGNDLVPEFNVPYYACFTISAGNDVWN
jgi:hypothetical protein